MTCVIRTANSQQQLITLTLFLHKIQPLRACLARQKKAKMKNFDFLLYFTKATSLKKTTIQSWKQRSWIEMGTRQQETQNVPPGMNPIQTVSLLNLTVNYIKTK